MSAEQRPAGLVTASYPGMSGISPALWQRLAPRGIDHSHAYLEFRERVEPGDPVLVVASDEGGPAAAVHGSWTTPRTALFSHPWKMLSSPQFARLPRAPDPASDPAALQHRRLLAALAAGQPPPSAGPGGAAALTAALGEVVVAREFDTSSVLLRTGLGTEARRKAIQAVLRGLQDTARARDGAVALPYVRPSDTELRQALSVTGFRCGTLTAITLFDLPGSYERFVAALPSRRRRRYRTEPTAFTAAGLRTRTVTLGEHLGRLVELEARNAERYGGTPDRTRLTGVRTQMSELLGPALRVPVADRRGEIIACCIDLMDGDSYLGLVYGCDYSVPEHRLAYRQLAFYEPLEWAADQGLTQVRMGFEAFEPKLYRGARLEARETWAWVPGQRAIAGLGVLLDFLSARTCGYLAELIPPGG